MTPGARVASAAEILDRILAGEPAEKALTSWARSHRFAGSGDRSAIRDHVYDVLRCRRSYAYLGGSETGRGLMLGAMRAHGVDVDDIFSGVGYAPPPLSESERAEFDIDRAADSVRLDVPDWLHVLFQESLGKQSDAVLKLMQIRAPLFLRANSRKVNVASAIKALLDEDIVSEAHPLCDTSILVTGNPRRVQNSQAYKSGLVEIQDVASQAVVELLPLDGGQRVLDYCAGGGGKSLAMAARADVHITAHDAQQNRMTDIAARAKRAGVNIETTDKIGLTDQIFDLVVCDVPCSGSGSWRRTPQAKWDLTLPMLDDLRSAQSDILDEATAFVGPSGTLAYITCSVFDCENSAQVMDFLARSPDWRLQSEHRFTPLDGGDGFYLAQLKRAS